MFLEAESSRARCRINSTVSGLAQLDKRFNNRRMRHVPAVVILLQLVEIAAPFSRNGFRIVQIRFVQLFDERSVCAEQIGTILKFFHHGVLS